MKRIKFIIEKIKPFQIDPWLFYSRITDDQGYADVGYNNPLCPIPTPNIDRLANDGIRLKQYYVHPTCTPTRAALLTGVRYW